MTSLYHQDYDNDDKMLEQVQCLTPTPMSRSDEGREAEPSSRSSSPPPRRIVRRLSSQSSNKSKSYSFNRPSILQLKSFSSSDVMHLNQQQSKMTPLSASASFTSPSKTSSSSSPSSTKEEETKRGDDEFPSSVMSSFLQNLLSERSKPISFITMTSDNAQTHYVDRHRKQQQKRDGRIVSPRVSSPAVSSSSPNTKSSSPCKWKHLIDCYHSDCSSSNTTTLSSSLKNASIITSPVILPKRKPSIESQQEHRRRLSLDIDQVLYEVQNLCVDDDDNPEDTNHSSASSMDSLPEVPKRKDSLVLQ